MPASLFLPHQISKQMTMLPFSPELLQGKTFSGLSNEGPHEGPSTVSSSLVFDHSFTLQLRAECEIPTPHEEPVSFHMTTQGCMQKDRRPGKAINIQKEKESERLQAHFKPVHLKLKASEQPDEGTCQ